MAKPAKQESENRGKNRGKNAVSWIILILGALLLLYPIASTLSYQYRTIKQNEAYAGAVDDLTDETKQEQLRLAHEYNDRLLAEGPHARPPEDSDPGFADYMSQLSLPEQYHMMARVRIPAINVDLPVYHTTRPKVLYDGAGHMYGSTLPVGGDGTNSVISAHTGMVNAAMFDQLPTLKPGEDIFIDVMGERLRYRMVSSEVVKPDHYEAVKYEPGKDQITLITCTPYGLNTDRLLVHAERAPLEAGAPEPKVSKFVWSWWMIAVLAIILLVLLLILWKYLRDRRKRRKREQARARATAAADSAAKEAGAAPAADGAAAEAAYEATAGLPMAGAKAPADSAAADSAAAAANSDSPGAARGGVPPDATPDADAVAAADADVAAAPAADVAAAEQRRRLARELRRERGE